MDVGILPVINDELEQPEGFCVAFIRLAISTPEINQSSKGGLGHCSIIVSLSLLLVVTCKNLGLNGLSCSFQSSRGEKLPNPKSGRNLDPDKPGCIISCSASKQTHMFLGFCSRFMTQLTDHIVGKGRLQLAPVEQPNKEYLS